MINDENVKFTGKEYLEYLKYKDKKPKFNLNKWLKVKNNRLAVTIAVIGLMFCLSLITIYNLATYQPPQPFNFTWEGIGMFVAVALGIGWIIHGVGFQLVRVR